ncbi:MAG TPA: DNA gyrase inhibitor YacG [Planctomycetota bacterium]|nr:DNA gyrase inhibitor YacG [Planctomycetota bacterium]
MSRSNPEYSCPTCKKPVTLGSKSFPFCSERCRLVDLGAWLTEKYAVPGPPLGPEERRLPPGAEDQNPDGDED